MFPPLLLSIKVAAVLLNPAPQVDRVSAENLKWLTSVSLQALEPSIALPFTPSGVSYKGVLK